jgi:ubiquinone/menaquinone biosynthesis C-methylase UbiE
MHSTYTFEEARAFLEQAKREYFNERLPVSPHLTYLDVGCGMGRVSIGLSLAGARLVTGIDINARLIEEARAISQGLTTTQQPEFVHADIHHWDTDRQFDVVMVLGAMEHIHDLGEFLRTLPRLMKPHGQAFLSIEPFQSVIGDHMHGFFRILIPWRGLLFSEKAIMRHRKRQYRPADPAERYHDIVGGLNQVRYEHYLRLVHDAGLEFVSHNCNPQFAHRLRYLRLNSISRVLTSIPKIRGYFIAADYSILKRRL